ncbi:helix-turn-helix domain-containing protein [[Actinomadura] parvosata]|uniref:helix-turn-helix domain-containing protein n=1 Tax=[Actinomadura] parvosata TaxID=1955412 RepID=UPI00406C7DAC
MDRETARQALAERVRRRRLALGWSIDEAAERGSMSPTTWTRVEEAKRVRDLTYAGIERALGWQAGSVDQIADGGEPKEGEGVQGVVTFTGEQALQVARQLPPAALHEILSDQTDPQLRQIIDAWPRLQQWQRNIVHGALTQILSQSPEMAGKPTPAEERRTG